jgi:hypothetical protein
MVLFIVDGFRKRSLALRARVPAYRQVGGEALMIDCAAPGVEPEAALPRKWVRLYLNLSILLVTHTIFPPRIHQGL